MIYSARLGEPTPPDFIHRDGIRDGLRNLEVIAACRARDRSRRLRRGDLRESARADQH